MSIRVIIAGFKGKMGQAACQMVLDDSDLDLVAVLDPFESESEWQGIPVFKDKADLVKDCILVNILNECWLICKN